MHAVQVPQCARLRRRRRQRQVGVDLAEEEPRARLAVSSSVCLPRQPMPALGRERDLEHRRAVGEHAVAERRRSPRDAIGEPLQPRAQHLVIVAAERVARDERLRRIGEHFVARSRVTRQIIHPRGDDATPCRARASPDARASRRGVPYNPSSPCRPAASQSRRRVSSAARSMSAMPICWKPSSRPHCTMSAASARQSRSTRAGEHCSVPIMLEKRTPRVARTLA